MEVFLITLAVIVIVGIVYLDIKIGFIVAEATEWTGFEFGFYLMTVLGLMAFEICLVASVIEHLK